MPKTLKTLLPYIPAVLCCIVIFCFSAQPSDASNDSSSGFIKMIFPRISEAGISSLQHVVRKSAHAFIYFLLSMLILFGIHQHNFKPLKRFFIAVTASALYACADEFHQLFVPGRSCRFTDILIDAGGAAAGALLVLGIGFAVRFMRSKKR